jgi:hypothetical protein
MKNYYDHLGVPTDSPEAVIRARIEECRAQLLGVSELLVDMARRELLELNEMGSVLLDPVSRARYDASLAVEGPVAPDAGLPHANTRWARSFCVRCGAEMFGGNFCSACGAPRAGAESGPIPATFLESMPDDRVPARLRCRPVRKRR